ncbi:MAG: toll/interleukin-1 receptor domain-containing protein [Candidatus Hodarchaeota archaeon]
MKKVDRSKESRAVRKPDLFLSYNSEDKEFVSKLADELTICQVDVWFDDWELQPGDSLQETISKAIEKTRYVGAIVTNNLPESKWTRGELSQAMQRERREDQTIVIPLICEGEEIPSYLEDKVYIDFRSHYYQALARLAGFIHDLSRQRIEEAIRENSPENIRETFKLLRYVGLEPYVIVGKDDFEEIKRAGGHVKGDDITFDPDQVLDFNNLSPRIRSLIKRLIENVW